MVAIVPVSHLFHGQGGWKATWGKKTKLEIKHTKDAEDEMIRICRLYCFSDIYRQGMVDFSVHSL
jgi:hypothetical protein